MKYLILLLSIVCISCAQQNKNTETETTTVTVEGISKILTPKEFAKTIASKNVQLIDVRTPEEYQEGNIINSKNINFYDEDFKEQMSVLNKNAPLAIYCRSGGRSGKAAKILKEMGFKEVYDLKGGYSLWSTTQSVKM